MILSDRKIASNYHNYSLTNRLEFDILLIILKDFCPTVELGLLKRIHNLYSYSYLPNVF